jgi:hypothetical protein
MGLTAQRHDLAALYLRERTHCTHWIGGCVGLRAGLNTGTRGKILLSLPGIESRSYAVLEMQQ